MRDRVDSEGVAVTLTLGVPHVLEDEQPALSEQGVAILKQNLALQGSVSVFDLEGAFKHDLLISMQLPGVQVSLT